MSRKAIRFNAKSRRNKDVIVDQADTNKIQVDLSRFSSVKHDESNALVLPSKKRKTAAIPNKNQVEKFLSKKQRKKLQHIVDRRQKKSDRADLLIELQKHQLPADIFAKLTPLVQVQTEGLKRLFRGTKSGCNVSTASSEKEGASRVVRPKSSIRGANKLKFRSWSGRFVQGADIKSNNDHKVLGLDDSSEDEDDDDSSSDESFSEKTLTVITNNNNANIDESIDEKKSISASDIAPTVLSNPNPFSEAGTSSFKKKPCGSETSEDVQSNKSSKSSVCVTPTQPKNFVQVHRTEEIEAVRSKLPIIPEEQVIMEAITENLVVVLAGETGSGKTTQVPQFLYEAGYALNGKIIGVTEPRRVAAVSMSNRVAKELNVSSDVVSYQIRFEGNASNKTKIKFMTDGVLLKEMEKDFLLTKYGAICIDEAHERSLYTDILIGLLSRCVLARNKRQDPLKLIVMSATMRVEDFIKNELLFKKPPGFIHIPTRQFPVQIHFNKVTPENHLLAALKKAAQIHRKLPPGGILIFVTGQQEVKTLIKQLSELFHAKPEINEQSSPNVQMSYPKRKTAKGKDRIIACRLKNFDLDKFKAFPLQAEESEDEVENSDDDDSDSEKLDVDLVEEYSCSDPMHILPLYSLLPTTEQQKVFETPPPGTRLCVVATNVAETSLTIPSIRYVVDCGKVKIKVWDKLTGVQQFKVSWCSKASSEQRSGRAGRTGPGHCYRLFSSAVYDSFIEYSAPEIQVRPVDDMMLLMKSMSIDRVRNFPYPSHPGEDQLVSAENILLTLGALEIPAKSTLRNRKDDVSQITSLGKTMSHFPLGPRFAKMLALSFHHGLVEYTVALVAALTVQEVFLDSTMHSTSKDSKTNWLNVRRKWAKTGISLLLGDCMVLLRAVGAFEFEGGTEEFCMRMGLRYKAMCEIRKLRKQMTSEINLLVNQAEETIINPQMKPPSDEEAKLLIQIILSGLPDKIARKINEGEIKDGEDKKKYKNAYRCGELQELVFIHASSVLRSVQPEWIVYQEVFESKEKMYLRGVTAIQPEWIPTFCQRLCRMEKPLKDPPPYYDHSTGCIKGSVKATYGKQAWELPVMEIEYPTCLEKYNLFAQFLLEGDIFPILLKWRPVLLSLPATMTKPWAKLQPRTQTLLQAIASNQIQRKSELEDKWMQDKNYLLKEYLEWIPQDIQNEVVIAWPPIEQ